MGKKSNQTVKIVIANPEAIDAAQEKFTRYIYSKYKEYLAERSIKETSDK